MREPLSGTGRSVPLRQPAGRGGFTLLEVVVATAVLIVLTLMIGSLFRQATSAWNTGRVRGSGSMIARSILGSVSRDLATAIDGRPYHFDSGGPEASGGTLEFVCRKAARSGKSVTGAVRGETIHKIRYSVSSSRATRRDEIWNGSSFGNGEDFVLFEWEGADSPIKDCSFETVGASPGARDGENAGALWTGPTAVKIRIDLSQKGSFSGVSVRSLGKNGREDDPKATDNDDITVN